MSEQAKLQWTMTVQVYHSRDFGHKILMCREKGLYGGPKWDALGTWKGLGVPESLLKAASTLVLAAFTEHLVNRYGVQGELPVAWAGEPDPF